MISCCHGDGRDFRKLLGHSNLVKLRNWCRSRPRGIGYRRLPGSSEGPTASKIRRWVGNLVFRSASLRAGEEEEASPKGQVAVYVEEGEGESCRVVVPVVYFNHPLFGELLREAEQVYGFTHSGGIKIPCPKSRLDCIQTKIATAGAPPELLNRRRSHLLN